MREILAMDPQAPDLDASSVVLEVFSDYTCPWCYIGWARLEQALEHFDPAHRPDVRWRPFEIHPEVPPEGMPVEALPYPPDVWARMQDALRQNAEAEGLTVGNRPKVANTHQALVASAWAQAERPELFPRFHEGLFVGYFAEGRDLGDPAELRGIAERAGLEPGAMAEVLESGRFESAIEETAAEARAMGITGTPTFVFDRRFGLSGAQPAELLAQAIMRAAREES
ncbi:MAG: DsbA family oxidoreductase [Gemmatimonadota bacterium]